MPNTPVYPPGSASDAERLRAKLPSAAGTDTVEMYELLQRQMLLALEGGLSHSKLQHMVLYDALTGLPNRGLVYAQLARSIREMADREAPMAVLLMDIDRFREVNEAFGQTVGDSVIRAIAHRLEQAVRIGDSLGRLGGDQFMVVLPHCDANGVDVVCAHMMAAIACPLEVSGHQIHPTISVGACLFPENGCDIDALVSHAEFALAQAKLEGGDRLSVFSPVLSKQATDKRDLVRDLRFALENGRLQLHYQAQINIHDGGLHGVEALARWPHPTRGLISPAIFIPLAEDAGLINLLGQWALREACWQLAAWRAQGIAVPSISVNLSPTNFQQRDLPRFIQSVLQEFSLQPNDLTLEMTESVLLDKQAETLLTLQALDEMGVKLSMDDFGTGYSSLGYLRRLPVSELKLDRSFVIGLEHDKASRTLASAIIRIGESMELTVVAEGVETTGQRDFLLDQGCRIAQGYLYAKPVSGTDFGLWRTEGGV